MSSTYVGVPPDPSTVNELIFVSAVKIDRSSNTGAVAASSVIVDPDCVVVVVPEPSRRMFQFSANSSSIVAFIAIVVLLFGAGRLPALGEALGKTIRGFKRATQESDSLEERSADAKALKSRSQVP